MCGIFGYVGVQEALSKVMEGIKRLDYRGYDSAGIAAISQGKLVCEKRVGGVSILEEILNQKNWPTKIAITHTRWATHGKPTVINAHPQLDSKGEVAIVHNGIIENHEQMRRMLEQKGVRFVSETDTEVISQLISVLYEGNFLKAVQRAALLLRGAFAIVALHQNHPDELICAARECPLVIGIGNDEMFVSSDASAFLKFTNRVLYLNSSEVAVVRANGVELFDAMQAKVLRKSEEISSINQEISKEGYEHFMLKEIFEQPHSLRCALASRYNEKFGTTNFEELRISDEELLKIQRIVIIACGTSYHAGLLGSYMIEEMARVPVQVEISSEYRYKNPIVQDHTLAIAISQSGETADTIAAMRELKEKGARIIGICNVQGSTLTREVDNSILLRAGPEIGVASTKAFNGQLMILALLSLKLSRMRAMSQKEGKDFIKALTLIPDQVKEILAQAEKIEKITKKYVSYKNFFYLGRRFMYPTALEGALKLKEISYVNANGYPAGEMKHGPIALINEECLTLALCSDSFTLPKMLSNLMEIKAREGKIIAIAEEGLIDIERVADEVIWVPKTIDPLAAIPTTVVNQLFAYYFAAALGAEIDRPRNLAKSVTVE